LVFFVSFFFIFVLSCIHGFCHVWPWESSPVASLLRLARF
jgi:hypothetical protein